LLIMSTQHNKIINEIFFVNFQVAEVN
jgi:hypothetical protein